MDEVAFLREISVFADLTTEEIGKIITIMKEINVPDGSTIIQEGDVGDSMYIIMDGSVEVSKTLTMKIDGQGFEEKEKILTRLNASDHIIFGEVGLLEDNVRTASVIAISTCTLREIKKEDFQKLADKDPRMGFKIVKNIARLVCTRLRKADEDTIKLTTALSIALSR
ncbi:MAG: cyclic nucleotide-binding domain-containing protein [Deltaproteobacteria bacterium]|jgi:CRP-like cAMP-binding protein|nr:MAG: cyclic nucleotide-binding domain-containing protein [Deltaproteobacteria bacterium]